MRAKADATKTANASNRVRFDKWLWAARFYKTRSLAAQAIEAGQARIDGERVKAAHMLRPGARVVLRRAGLTWNVVVMALSDKRGGAAVAAKLYAEAPESAAARESEILRRKAATASAPLWEGRPTKRDRRKLQEFLDEA
jgi:ribosome-associated heat shock protein Hsp15